MKFVRISSALIGAAAATMLFSVSAFAANLGIISGHEVNVRSDSSTNSGVIKQFSNNEVFTVTAAKNSFYKINGQGINDGYVSFEFFKIISADAQIAGNGVNIRKEPSKSAEVVTQLNLGTPVTVVGQNESWYAVKYNGSLGYVSKEFALGTFINKVPSFAQMVLEVPKQTTQTTTTEATTQATTKAQATTTETTTQATTQAPAPITQAPDDQPAIVDDEPAAPVAAPEAAALDLTADDEPVQEAEPANTGLGQQMVSFAMQYLGTPYVYGGTDLNSGVDCSGFTSSIYKHFGISINRVSRDQISNGAPVSKNNLQPGDLVFFNTGGNSSISHVGMYIGDGQYIHSTDSKGRGVSIGNLNDTYSLKTYYGACRVIS